MFLTGSNIFIYAVKYFIFISNCSQPREVVQQVDFQISQPILINLHMFYGQGVDALGIQINDSLRGNLGKFEAYAISNIFTLPELMKAVVN